MGNKIRIPYNFTPRDYQIPLYNALPDGYTRGVVIWHRRAGKDKTFINTLVRETFKRVGTYFYILPYYKQARLIIWEGMDSAGFKFMDHFPTPLIQRKDNQQMVIELKNGSIVRMVGSDNIDSIVGSNPIGVIFSEFSLHKIAAWNYLRPILMENKGWSLFNGTPRGRNHLYKIYQDAKANKDAWYHELLTIDDTRTPDGKPVISQADVEQERQMGMPEELIQQEFYCSFDAGLVGTIVGDLIVEAKNEGRITRVPHDPNLPVVTAWDLGYDDTNVIIFAQFLNREVRIIDCFSANRKSIPYYVQYLQSKSYTYQEHFMPHDIEVHEYSTGTTRRESFENLGVKNIQTIPRMKVADKYAISEGHNYMRQLIPRCYFDEERTNSSLVEGLNMYRREWDEKNQKFSDHAIRDWSVHFADAFRMLAAGERMLQTSAIMPDYAMSQYNELQDPYGVNAYNPLDDYLQYG